MVGSPDGDPRERQTDVLALAIRARLFGALRGCGARDDAGARGRRRAPSQLRAGPARAAGRAGLLERRTVRSRAGDRGTSGRSRTALPPASRPTRTLSSGAGSRVPSRPGKRPRRHRAGRSRDRARTRTRADRGPVADAIALRSRRSVRAPKARAGAGAAELRARQLPVSRRGAGEPARGLHASPRHHARAARPPQLDARLTRFIRRTPMRQAA